MNRAGVELTAYAVKRGLPFVRIFRLFGFGGTPWRQPEPPGWFASFPDHLKRTPVFLGPDSEKARAKLDALADELKPPVPEFKPVVEPMRKATASRKRAR